MGKQIHAAVAGLCLAAQAAWGQVATYDDKSGMLTISSVSVGAATFTDVKLKNTGGFTLELADATAQKPAAPGAATYDAASGTLSLPSMQLGDATLLDVKFQNHGNFVFQMSSSTPLPAGLLDEVKALAAKLDGLWADGVPATGALALSVTDACYRNSGRTKAYAIDDFDADRATIAQRSAFEVGRRSQNIRIMAVREKTNDDGSSRREIDTLYDIQYKDGTVDHDVPNTLISGSSAGTPGCSTAETGSTLRYLGNQQLVAFGLQARVQRDERYSVGIAAPSVAPAVAYRREVRWSITDPMANATYVILSGPGPSGTVAGETVPFSLKMVSPFLMRAAPEMARRNGNFLNWRDDDTFRMCQAPGGAVPVAQIADCTGLGAAGDNWGWTTGLADGTADQNFDAQGFIAGGMYRIDVYNDDGWKTVNGQQGKTPIATYWRRLDKLPYTFRQMAGRGIFPALDDGFPKFDFAGQTMSNLQANFSRGGPLPVPVTWTLPRALPDGAKFGVLQMWEFTQGGKLGNPGNAFFPAIRQINYSYPGSDATSGQFPATAKPADMGNRTYVEYMLWMSDRNQGVILSRVSFQ